LEPQTGAYSSVQMQFLSPLLGPQWVLSQEDKSDMPEKRASIKAIFFMMVDFVELN